MILVRLAGSMRSSALRALSTRPLWKSSSRYARASMSGGAGTTEAADADSEQTQSTPAIASASHIDFVIPIFSSFRIVTKSPDIEP